MKAFLLATLAAVPLLAQEKPTPPSAPAPATAAAPATVKELASRRLHLTSGNISTPDVKVVFDGTPDDATKAWAGEAAALVREWWPQVARLLATENFRSPEQLTLFFKPELKVPAYRTAEGLYINVSWITKRPDDFGMVIHEMTHAIQDYRKAPRDAGWLVEGIADYIRYWHYEPEASRPRFDPAKASYRDAYGTTATFLAWLVAKHDRRIVRRLDAALRKGEYKDALFEEITGKNLDTLWQEFIATRRS